jgi:tRNA(Ile)-lysidine synthase
MGDRRPELVQRVRAFLEGPDAPPAGSHLLIAASGGPDSTALALVMAELGGAHGLRSSLGHVRHGLRSPDDEAADEALVRTLGRQLGMDVRCRAVRLSGGGNLEERARVARREALRAMAAEIGATHVALAHTQDDQAETMLLRLVRGGGRGALAGMRARRGAVVRPLLAASRADVRWYLGERRQEFTIDRSNADLRHARNRVRRLLLPLLSAEFNPDVVRALAGLASRLRDEEDVLERAARRRAARLVHDERLGRAVAALPPALARRVVRHWLTGLGVSRLTAVQVARVLALAGAERPGACVLAGPSRVVREGDVLVWRTGLEAAQERIHAPLEPGGSVVGPAWRLDASAPRPWAPGDEAAPSPEETVVDVEALPGPLAVRPPRPGDRVHLAGVGTRKLQDVLVDRKVPREARASLPVVVAGDVVLWIPGIVRSSAARAGGATRTVLALRLHALTPRDNVALPLTKPYGTVSTREH